MSSPPSVPADGVALKGLRKRKVVDTSTAETVGRVQAVHLDPARSAVVGIVVRGTGAVPFTRVLGIGPDAVTVASAADVVGVDGSEDLGPLDTDGYGSRVLDEAGHELGKLTDLRIDDQGSVTAVVVDGHELDRPLRGIGSYAVVVGHARS